MRHTAAGRRPAFGLKSSAAILAVLLLILALSSSALGAPDGKGGGKGGGKNKTGDCHPKKGCPSDTESDSPEPTTSPDPEPTSTPSPTPTDSPASEPSPEPSPPAEGDTTSPGDWQITDTVVTNPASSQSLVPIGRGRMATDGSVSALLYAERFSNQPWLYLRDASTGSGSHVALPYDSLTGWFDAAYVLRGSDLWIFSGSGPMYFRHYTLSGSPLPTAATLTSVRTFGDSDSRPGDMIRLSSGGLVSVWHQQGATGPQGHYVAYRDSKGQWSTHDVRFMPTRASKDALAQHPLDGSVWLFSNPDAWSSIGAARFTETSSGLRLDWTDPYFIDSRYGDFGADPENPDVVAAPDASSGEIVLAYQSAHRKRFSTSVLGSHPAIARISANADMKFMHLPIYVERVSRLGLAVASGKVWLAHRPVDPETLTFDVLHLSRHAGGKWETAKLGTLFQSYERVAYGVGRSEFGARLVDERIHLYTSN